MNFNKVKVSFLTHFFILLSPILWIWWCLSYELDDLVKYVFILPIILFLSLYFISFHQKLRNIRISLFSISMIFLLSESFSQIGTINQWLDKNKFRPVEQFYLSPFPQFNQAHAQFNQNIGFKWNYKQATVEKFAGEELIFKNTFKGNNYGFHAAQDYTPEKPSNVKRWIVFGDSFTDGYFLQNTWVDEMNELYLKDSISIELYSFSVNGGGIRNWNQMFQKLIQAKFEYDGVIFAVFGNDLKRDFFVLHQDKEQELYKYYDHIPSQSEVDLDLKNSIKTQQNFTQLFKGEFIYTSKICNYILRTYLTNKFNTVNNDSQRVLQNEFIISNDPTDINLEFLENKYLEKFQIFNKLIDTIKSEKKEIILLSIPELNGLKMNEEGSQTQIQKELKLMANEYQLDFIDGYQLLINSEVKSLDSLYFKNDGHWNQIGSDEFALQLYKKYHSLLN